jgi:hypothetical protein
MKKLVLITVILAFAANIFAASAGIACGGRISKTTTNRYLFSGKELQTTGEINYMDFGSRMYDDFLGRWFAIDPRAEDYYPLSP